MCAKEGNLSVYDENNLKKYQMNMVLDWKLVASLIAQESAIDPYARKLDGGLED